MSGWGFREWNGPAVLLPHRRVMLKRGDCQMEHRHIEQINATVTTIGDFNGVAQCADGGLLLLRAAERKVGVCERLAAVMPDHRDPNRILHEMFEMLMACGVAVDHLPAGEFGKQDRRGAACRGSGRSVMRDGEAEPG
jgi:hypothetical protein